MSIIWQEAAPEKNIEKNNFGREKLLAFLVEWFECDNKVQSIFFLQRLESMVLACAHRVPVSESFFYYISLRYDLKSAKIRIKAIPNEGETNRKDEE